MGLFDKLFNNDKTENINDYYDINGSFHMIVDDVFTITGKGIVVTGKIDSGEIHLGDSININNQRNTIVDGIEMFRKTLDYAKAGDCCGILLKDISKDDIHRGDILTK